VGVADDAGELGLKYPVQHANDLVFFNLRHDSSFLKLFQYG
jgi:hypothetical protein